MVMVAVRVVMMWLLWRLMLMVLLLLLLLLLRRTCLCRQNCWRLDWGIDLRRAAVGRLRL